MMLKMQWDFASYMQLKKQDQKHLFALCNVYEQDKIKAVTLLEATGRRCYSK